MGHKVRGRDYLISHHIVFMIMIFWSVYMCVCVDEWGQCTCVCVSGVSVHVCG